MADGTFPTLISKDREANAVGNPIYIDFGTGATLGTVTTITNAVTIQDGGNTITVDGTVGVSGNVTIVDGGGSITVDGTVAATQSGTWDITSITNDVDIADGGNSITVDDGATTLSIDDGGGSITVDGSLSMQGSYVDDGAYAVGTDYAMASGYLMDETSPDTVNEGDIGIARMTADRKQIMVIADATTDSQRLAIDASGNAQVDIAAVSVTAVPISKDGNANSEANPIYVYPVANVTSGTEVQNYDTSTVSSDTADNHDYAVTGTTFFLKSVIASASGGMKFEVQAGPVGSLVTKAVGFIPRQGGVAQLDFNPPIEVPVTSTGTVRVIRTNRQGASMDVYSTIIGNDV